MRKYWRSFLSLVMALVMVASLGLGAAETAAEASETAVVEEATDSAAENSDTTNVEEIRADANAAAAERMRAVIGGEAAIYTHHGQVTFVDGAVADHPVADITGAEEVLNQLAPALSPEHTPQFIPWRTVTDAAGNHYYVFQQVAAGTTVCGGAVKIITDFRGNTIGLTSSLVENLPEAADADGISQTEAEQLVMEKLSAEGKNAALVPNTTDVIILPLILDVNDEENDDSSRYVWVVYTRNMGASVGASSDLPYLAHYVTMEGKYLYSLPTMNPGDETGSSGFDSSYVFEFMEPVDYTGYVDMADGEEKELTVTLMRDRRTGMYYLGNIERRIVVADCYEFLYHDGQVVLESSRDNLEWDQVALKSFYNYCRVWDYYQELGWIGGDGLGTPILVLNNFCDENGDPIDNAAFVGTYLGWSIFVTSQANDYAESLDIIAHEFTHCVTGAVMTFNSYMNDYGAINEAISDIQGQLCELMMEPEEDAVWLLGEDSGEAVRSMSDPLAYDQPAYTWDLYYQPNVQTPTEMNDEGGVHTNSSLLNLVAYQLNEEGGLSLAQQRDFWFAADCAMVPGTDYAQLRELLPWVLRHQGLESAEGTLTEAMANVRLGESEIPETLPEGRAILTLTLPEGESFADGNWAMQIVTIKQSGLLEHLLNSLGENMEDDQTEDEFFAWLMEEVGPYLFTAMGSAGQDGRTVQMVTQPGHTIPILFHMNMDETTQEMNQLALAVHLNGKWYNLTSLIGLFQMGMDESEEEEMDYIALLNSLLEDDSLQSLAFDMIGMVFLGLADNPVDVLATEVPEGEVTALPSEGLEKITWPENGPVISLAAMEGEANEETQQPRMSRPKVVE